MLDRVNRNHVERIRHAHRISIVINAGEADFLQLDFNKNLKTLCNEIGIAVQSYLNKPNK